MKLALSSDGPTLEAAASPIFGRCAYFLFIDTETGAFEAKPNPARDDSGGAGVQAAQFVLDQGAQALISGHLGPNAAQIIEAAGIPMYVLKGQTGAAVLDHFRAGALDRMSTSGGGGRGQGRGKGFGGRGRGFGGRR